MADATPDQIASALAAVLVPDADARTDFMVIYGAVQDHLKAKHGTSSAMAPVKSVLHAAGLHLIGYRPQLVPGVRLANPRTRKSNHDR